MCRDMTYSTCVTQVATDVGLYRKELWWHPRRELLRLQIGNVARLYSTGSGRFRKKIRTCEYMSIYRNRMIRQMYKDVYLPIFCNATKNQFYSIFGECKCMTDCKFTHESRQSRDFRNSRLVKDLESRKNNYDPPSPTRKEKFWNMYYTWPFHIHDEDSCLDLLFRDTPCVRWVDPSLRNCSHIFRKNTHRVSKNLEIVYTFF